MLTRHTVISGCIIFCLLILHFRKTEAENLVLNFTCDGNKIKSIDTDHLDKVYIILNETTHIYCKPISKNLTKCFDQARKNLSELKVLYEEDLNHPNIIGGKKVHFFHLVCKENYKILSATASFSKITNKGNYTENVKNISLEGKLTLRISETPETPEIVNKIQNVVVGQHLYLFLKGPAQHVINPEECTAKPINKSETKSEQLWKRNSSCTGSKPDLIDQKWTNKDDQLYIGMYAFRFNSSDEVTITCRAFVCPVSDRSLNCTRNCVNGREPGVERRRRDAIVGSQLQHAEKSASASFRIVKRKTPNSAAGLSTTSVSVVFLLFNVTKWM